MFKKLRSRLSPRDVGIVKLVMWAALLTWMVFFFAFGVVLAPKLANPDWYSGFGSELFAGILAWVAPIWVVFTSLMVIVYVARFAYKKLGVKKEETGGQ